MTLGAQEMTLGIQAMTLGTQGMATNTSKIEVFANMEEGSTEREHLRSQTIFNQKNWGKP